MEPNTILVCTKCGLGKPCSEFYKDNRGRKQYKAECKECIKKRMKEWRKKNPGKVKDQNLRRKIKKAQSNN